jgi:dihydroorotate dehydrogenase
MNLFAVVRPLMFRLSAETAHRAAVRLLALGQALGCAPRFPVTDYPELRVKLWDLEFRNPLGLAAGFDKNAEAVDALLNLGFGFVEAGSVTPRPQPGNPLPRLFRLPEHEAVVNRMGFNNDGLEAFARRLQQRIPAKGRSAGVVGANLGKNKDTVDAADDYVIGARRLADLADYLVINVSSPNTPGLRALQGREPLRDLLTRTLAARNERPLDRYPPVLLKIAPDLTDEDKADIAAVALETGVDGLIISNTTIARPDEIGARWKQEAGGLSGRPLFAASTQVLGEMYKLTGGKLPLVGAGGIFSAADAYAKIRAGASLVQVYSALVYRGPGLPAEIVDGLAARLKADGFDHVTQAVGADHR